MLTALRRFPWLSSYGATSDPSPVAAYLPSVSVPYLDKEGDARSILLTYKIPQTSSYLWQGDGDPPLTTADTATWQGDPGAQILVRRASGTNVSGQETPTWP